MDSRKRVSIVGYGITLLTFIVILLFCKFYMKPGQEMGYTILNFYIISPAISFVVGLNMGILNAYLKWIYPIFSGLFCFAVLIIFPGSWDWICLFFSLIPALLGLLIGFKIWKVRISK